MACIILQGYKDGTEGPGGWALRERRSPGPAREWPHIMAIIDLVKRFADAVAHQEGFYAPPNAEGLMPLPKRACNPTDMTDEGNIGYGTLGEGITIYPNEDSGWLAAWHKFGKWFSGRSTVYPLDMTLSDVGLKYSGGDANWARNVSARLGVSESTTLGDLVAAEQSNVVAGS